MQIKLCFTYVIVFIAVFLPCAPVFAQVDGTDSFVSGGITRTFNYHLPTNAPGKDLPLVIVLHGAGGTGAGIKATTGFDAIANTENFIVVYPNSTNIGGTLQWNAYADGTPGHPSDANATDDVNFTSDLIDYFYEDYQINRNKVYVTGFSNGGFMAYYLALALPGQITAIAPVAASLWGDWANYIPANLNEKPIFHIHGTADGVVIPPAVNANWIDILSNYAQGTAGGCDGTAYYTETPYPGLTEYIINSCGNDEVKLHLISGLGHAWPSNAYTPLSPARVIWAFFNTFSLSNYKTSSLNNIPTPPYCHQIKVDQFGYLPTAQKIANISWASDGYNNDNDFYPSLTTYELRRKADNQTVFSGNNTMWKGGIKHDQSGDYIWQFDFSAFTTPGTYYVYEPISETRSDYFNISDYAYRITQREALHAFYYQRCGVAKNAAYTTPGHDDAICHNHANQDLDCQLVTNPLPANSKNLSGGWHDAGDFNKYTNFTLTPVQAFLYAYEENSIAWTDNFGIPESGNNIPDILDELKIELDWLLKMQNANGSVLNKVSVANFAASSPPSTDLAARFYGEAGTTATLTAAANFAHAAIVYKSLGISSMTTYGNTLQTAAINAYTWANANPNIQYFNTGFSSMNPEYGDFAYNRDALKVSAAAYLYALTGNATYRTDVDNNYGNVHLLQWGFAYPFEGNYQDALLYYAKTSGATALVANNIKTTYKNSITGTTENLPAFTSNEDAYRAYLKDADYTWGSNTTKSIKGNMFSNMYEFGVDVVDSVNYRNACAGFLHYFHGFNPNGLAFFTNMNKQGAIYSVDEIYHAWFHDGSTNWDRVGESLYGPPSGFIPGGVNPTYVPDGACNCTINPPQNQPIQKSYHSWNTSWPQNSWEITEIGIYTQAAYLRLVSQFVSPPCITNPQINGPVVGDCLPGAVAIYSVAEIPNSTYTWTVTGGTILSGQGTPFITVQWTTGSVGTVDITQGYE
jgi:endoglucanase